MANGRRIASFNVENLFSRASAMNLASWSEGKEILAEYSRLNTLLQVPAYSQTDKEAILAGIDRLGLYRNDESKFVVLRQNHGRLLKRPTLGPPEVVAEGRGAWIGWLELKTDPARARSGGGRAQPGIRGSADGAEVEKGVAAMEARLRKERPEVNVLFVKPQMAAAYNASCSRSLGASAIEEMSEGVQGR
jgi:hypothetical protein